jgi:hypothetical protein
VIILLLLLTSLGALSLTLFVSPSSAVPRASGADAKGLGRPGKILWYADARGRSAKIGVRAGYCYGEPRPHIVRTLIRERPKTARRSGRAIIEVYLSGPKVPESGGPPPGESSEPVDVCSGIEYQIEERVTFKRPVSSLQLLDGYTHPPSPVRHRR